MMTCGFLLSLGLLQDDSSSNQRLDKSNIPFGTALEECSHLSQLCRSHTQESYIAGRAMPAVINGPGQYRSLKYLDINKC